MQFCFRNIQTVKMHFAWMLIKKTHTHKNCRNYFQYVWTFLMNTLGFFWHLFSLYFIKNAVSTIYEFFIRTFCIQASLTLLIFGILALCQKLNKTFGSNLEYLPVFKAQRVVDPKQNAGTIHKFNLDHLLFLKSPCRDNARVPFRTPPCFKTPCGDNPWVQSGIVSCI